MADSREIYTNQTGVHNNLETVVRKHLNADFRKPPAEHTIKAFERVSEVIATAVDRPLILDSCCGTGVSSRKIAVQHPQAWVIALDRSAKRLNKQYGDELPENLIFAQADCVDFWKLARQADWQLQKHYLLYPNPYPKSVQLNYRWHGHPAFADLLALGGVLEVRSNWQIYIEEFSIALTLAGWRTQGCEVFDPKGEYMTLFERKYCESGQTLYRCLSQAQ
ncbi:MAG: SAM-dependent methyltransferase [Proteobacteria bacterium]|nr:MAG: SAM-dependent methyltransferase [Pseudomonadota bacterium]